MTIPLILKIFISLGLILTMNRVVKNLAISVGSGALLIALWSGRSITETAIIAFRRAGSIDNIMLMLLISLVISLSNQMSRSGTMKELVAAMKQRVSPRGALAALPAIIGLLPMPGGAIFSAPLLDDCDEDKELSPMEKTRINYWFRHVWESTWPLYPGVILAADIAGIAVWQIFLLGLPVSGAALLAGYIFYLKPLKGYGNAGKKPPAKVSTPSGCSKSALLPLLMPILIVPVVYAIFLILMPAVSSTVKYLPMITGLLVSMAYLQRRSPLAAWEWKAILFNSRTAQMVLIVLAVRIYGAYVEMPLSDGRLFMEQLRLEMYTIGVPLGLLTLLIPFISGLTTGVSVGFVGASFPVVFSLLGPEPALGLTLSTLILAYPSGFLGTMMSPVHVCLVVTNVHFGTAPGPVIRSLAAPALLLMAASGLVSLLVPFFI
jgi:uncharacterized protein